MHNPSAARYERGAVGLVGGKRVIVTIARGGFYCEGSPTVGLKHAKTYLGSLSAFIGIRNLQAISADGISVGLDQHQAAIDQAQREITEFVI